MGPSTSTIWGIGRSSVTRSAYRRPQMPPAERCFAPLVKRFTRPSHALSFTFSPTPPTMATERRMRLRKGELRTCCPFVTYPEERPQVPEDRRRCALRPSGFEEEADTKCQTQLVP